MKGLLGSSSKSDGLPPTPGTIAEPSPGGRDQASFDTPYAGDDQEDAGAGYIQPAFSRGGVGGDSSGIGEREGSMAKDEEGEAIKVNIPVILCGNICICFHVSMLRKKCSR